MVTGSYRRLTMSLLAAPAATAAAERAEIPISHHGWPRRRHHQRLAFRWGLTFREIACAPGPHRPWGNYVSEYSLTVRPDTG